MSSLVLVLHRGQSRVNAKYLRLVVSWSGHARFPISKGESVKSRWFALFALTAVNYLNYIDRNIFSALAPAIKSDLGFTDMELGMLGSAFLYMYTISAPLFGHFGDRGGRSRIMAGGVAIWSVATAFSGICTSFVGHFLTRVSVGFGESAYTVIAPATIADHFKKDSRGVVFAVYSGAITIGSALGYVLGGLLHEAFGWRKAFFVVGVPGLALAALIYFMPDPKRGSQDESYAPLEPGLSLRQVYVALFRNGGFLWTVLGYSAYTFVVGGLAFWMPSYLVRYFNVSLGQANIHFGALTVLGGFIGTVVGGIWADRLERRSGNGYLRVSAYSILLSVPLFFISLAIGDYKAFMASLLLLEVALFICISPLDAAVIGYVRPSWRATAMALTVFIIHVLGDGISRPALGFVSDRSGLQTAMAILPWMLLVAGLCWVVGFAYHWQPAPLTAGALVPSFWQAHRGDHVHGGAVENTLEAFRSARARGAEMAECDVLLTKDGRAVIFHDDDLRRLAGRPQKVSEVTANEMMTFTKAPLLEELLSESGAPAFLNIELKSGPDWRQHELEDAVVRAVRVARAEKRVMFSSFNPFILRRLARLAPEIPRGLIATEERDPANPYYLRKLLLGFWAKAHFVHLDERMLSRARIEAFHERGLKVYAWTVNDRGRAKELREWGVDGIITDTLFVAGT